MNYTTAQAVLKNVGILICVFWVILFLGFSAEVSRGNLEGDGFVVSIIFLVTCVPCIGGIYVLTDSLGTTTRFFLKKIGVVAVVLPTVALQITLVIVNFSEWLDPKCENDILSLCASGKENFLLMVCLSTVIHMAFFMFYKVVHVYYVNMVQVFSSSNRRYPIFTAEDNDSVTAQPEGLDPDNGSTV
jgi:hypothetical protein